MIPDAWAAGRRLVAKRGWGGEGGTGARRARRLAYAGQGCGGRGRGGVGGDEEEEQQEQEEQQEEEEGGGGRFLERMHASRHAFANASRRYG